MNLNNIIAENKNKTIYKDGDKVIKVFNETYLQAEVLSEALNQTIAYDLNLPVPKVYEVCKINNKWAIISEFIEGETIAHLIRKDPCKQEALMDMFTSLQMEVFLKKGYKLQSQYSKINDAIATLNIDAITRFAIHDKVNSMHKHMEFCHGDFVPSNVILSKDNKLFILDFAKVSFGNPLIDIVTSYIQISTHMQDEKLANLYLENIIAKSKYEKEDIDKWVPVISAFLATSEKNEEVAKRFLDLFLNI